MKKFGSVASTFGSVALTASVAVSLSACDSDFSDPNMSNSMTQSELAEYCGMDLNKIKSDLQANNQEKNKTVQSVSIADIDCTLQISYVENGETKEVSVDNDTLAPMLAYGGMGALLGYMWANPSRRVGMINQYNGMNRSGISKAPYSKNYFNNNSRSLKAYSSNTSISAISSRSAARAGTSRTNSFRGISSAGRASTYSGG